MTRFRAHAILPVLLILSLSLSACCSSPPAVGKYFNRQTPMSALLGFSYSVEIENWDYAFESLTAETREQVKSPFWLDLGTWNEKDPIFNIPVRDILTGAIGDRGKPESTRPNVVTIPVAYTDPDDPEQIPIIFIDVILLYEEGEWRVDLLRTLEALYRDVELPS